MPSEPGNTNHHQLVLTADTAELQTFVLKHLNDTNAFGDATEMTRWKGLNGAAGPACDARQRFMMPKSSPPNPAPAVKLKPTMTISLCLNLALAGAAVWLLKKPVSPMPETGAATISETTTALATASRPAASSPPAPATATYVTNPFAWSKVEAEDWEQLATNLRAIGCPEKTVRDIVLARGRRALEQISKEAEPNLTFWTAGLRRTHARQEAARQAQWAQAEIIARLERIVGPDVFLGETQMMDKFEAQAMMRFVAGPLPDETFSQVAIKLAGFEARRQALDARTQGVWLDADEAELAQLRTQYHRELAALLQPAELEEMTARMAMLPQLDRLNFEATDLNAAEVRQLGVIRARFVDPLE